MNSIQVHLQSHNKSSVTIDVEAQQVDSKPKQAQNDCKQSQTNPIYSEMKVFSISANLKANDNCPID